MSTENTETEMVLLAQLVTVNCKHTFEQDELLQKSQQIAHLISDINHEEEEKKAVGAQYKNKIDTLKSEAKMLSSHITNGFMYTDKPAALYLDYETNQRVYVSKEDGEVLKTEPFHPSDYQKKIDFDEEENARQQQIDENNATGEFAEAQLFDAVDQIIVDKKVAKVKKLKPTPKDVLPDNYGRDFEQEDEDPFAPVND